MSEILFRGKRVDNGEWVFGYLIIGEKTYIATDDSIQYMVVSISGMASVQLFEIDPATIGQYTGLVDRNDTKIFDGDILDCGDRVVVVYWNKFNGLWDSRFIRYNIGVMLSKGITAVEWKYRTMVIGNVHNKKDI